MDSTNLLLKTYIRIIRHKLARYSFYIYARACIVNKSECALTFYYSSAIGRQRIAGQPVTDSNVLMISNRPSIRVGLSPRNASRQLSIRSFCALLSLLFSVLGTKKSA